MEPLPAHLVPLGELGTAGGGHRPRLLQGPQGPAGSISDLCHGAGAGDGCLLRTLWLLDPQKLSV